MLKGPLKFALVGCGRIGERHAEHIHQSGKLIAVCDIVPDKVDILAKQYGTKAYHQLGELLKNEMPDLVSICTPNGLHAQHTIAALRAGCHVLCEKPMAISVADCRQMIKEAEKANRRLFIVKQNRFNPPVLAIKRLIEEGRLGRLLSVQLNCFWNRTDAYYANSWRGTKELDGGTLFTQFSHFIDLLYWLVGDIQEITAYTTNSNHKNVVEFEDQGVVILKFSGGALGTIHFTVNGYKKNMEGSVTIFGEKGTVKVGGQYLNELEYQQIEDYEITGLPAGNPPNHYGEYQGSMSNHGKVYENVVKVLTGSDVMATNEWEGMKTVEIIERIYQAADNSTSARY